MTRTEKLEELKAQMRKVIKAGQRLVIETDKCVKIGDQLKALGIDPNEDQEAIALLKEIEKLEF